MKHLLLSLFCLLLPYSSALEIRDFLKQDGGCFKHADADTLLAANSPYRRYFRWVSMECREARYPAWINTTKDLTYDGKPVTEAILRFRKDRSLKEIYLSLYNRGDDGRITYQEFEKRHEALIQHFQQLTGDKGHRRRATIDAGMKTERHIWIHDDLAYILRASITGTRSLKRSTPEYLQLEIKPFDPKDDPREESMTRVDRQQVRAKKSLQENLVTQPNGTVFIQGIPMVDQGQKGYCVVATIERVMRYFNIEQVNQHTLAQIARSSPNFGTSIDTMLEAFKKASSKLKVTISDEFSLVESIRDIEKIVKDYNRLASRKDRKKKVRIVYHGRVLNLPLTMRKMDPEIYLESRDQKRWRKKFQRIVEEHIAEGLPILWSVMTGVAPSDQVSEPFGAHLRLIIGYNLKTQKIIYSDSWGAGHEKKEMPMKDACAITMRMMVMKPRN